MPKSARDHSVKSVKNPKLDYNDNKIKNEKYMNRRLTYKYCVEWMRWNGVYLYAYGCSLSGIACAVLSPLFNLYQGGNLYPYFSEVIRSGWNKVIFMVGCTIGCIPSLYFSLNYLRVSFKYSQLFRSKLTKVVYCFLQIILYLLFIYSIFSVIGVSICDMDNFPDAHTFFSSTWVFFTNLMEVIQLVVAATSIYRGGRKDDSYVWFKAILSFLSCAGMINFVVLGSYIPCYGKHMPMEECLLTFDEKYCFDIHMSHSFDGGVTVLRQYSHCPILHPIRGFGEFIAVVCTMFYLTTMVYDLKVMRGILWKEYDADETGITMQDMSTMEVDSNTSTLLLVCFVNTL